MQINPYVAFPAARPEVVSEDASNSPQNARIKEELPQGLSHDRVEVVKTQNIAATEIEVVDLEGAFQLLSQLRQDLPQLQASALAQLYQYDHLRNIFAG